MRRNLDEAEGHDALGQRVQALEEMVKLGQIDQSAFEKLREEIGIGGDVKSTHLVKGLDRKLLQKVKAGEDITETSTAAEYDTNKPDNTHNVDDEFESVLEEKGKEVKPVVKEQKAKKGTMAPPPPSAPGRKRTRDELLKQLKASRAAGTSMQQQQQQQQPEPPASTLGDKFKKIGGKDEKHRWVEKDEKGRRKEVLVTTDSEGKTKRKVRWLDKPDDTTTDKSTHGLLAPDKDAIPLGMDVPAEVLARAGANAEEGDNEDDDDIFAGVGTDYNPLAELGEDDDSSSDSEGEVKPEADSGKKITEQKAGQESREEQTHTAPAPRPRNYFSTSSTQDANPTEKPPSSTTPFASDPTIAAALKRAAAIRQASPSAGGDDDDDGEVKAGLDSDTRGKKFLEEARKRDMQDAMDMDLGFGGSRLADEEEEEEVYWEEGGQSNKRKRGPKKRKGDKDSAGDVMKVIEGRQKGDNGKSSAKRRQ